MAELLGAAPQAKPLYDAVVNAGRLIKETGANAVKLEGGAAVHDAFLDSGLWDEIISYVTPKLIGGNGKAAGGQSDALIDLNQT